MLKRCIKIASVLFMAALLVFPAQRIDQGGRPEIKRLTFSGNAEALYPCLSDDGRWMAYVLEVKDEEKTTKVLKVMNTANGRENELFRSGERKAPAPYEDVFLEVGSKPPLLSGNGRKAVFSLSLAEPVSILDHYLAIVNTDGSDWKLIEFPNQALTTKDLRALEFESANWERVANYAVSADGNRVACALKGHLGPRRYGNASAIILLDVQSGRQRTILAPDFDEKGWVWDSYPRHPFTGGGWAFCLSGDGETLVFGSQSSPEKSDYDLYLSEWEGKEVRRLTDFEDRWFSLADISHDGEAIVFFYNGQKKSGMGTYLIRRDGSGLKFISSQAAPRVEFFDLSSDGRYILFMHVYKGMRLDLITGQEKLAFDEETPDYVHGLFPMDFPRFPAFWGPRIMSSRGDRILLVGPPLGREKPEIYLLNMGLK